MLLFNKLLLRNEKNNVVFFLAYCVPYGSLCATPPAHCVLRGVHNGPFPKILKTYHKS